MYHMCIKYECDSRLTTYVVGFFRKGASCSKRLERIPLFPSQAPILHNHHPANEPSFKVYSQPLCFTSYISSFTWFRWWWLSSFLFWIPIFLGLQPFQPEILQKRQVKICFPKPRSRMLRCILESPDVSNKVTTLGVPIRYSQPVCLVCHSFVCFLMWYVFGCSIFWPWFYQLYRTSYIRSYSECKTISIHRQLAYISS